MNKAKIIFRTALFIGIAVSLQVSCRYCFFFIEQLQLFLFTGSYASETILQPGGLSLYIARFIVQFYYIPFAGSVATALLATTAGILTYGLLNRFIHTVVSHIISLLPVGLITLLHTNYRYNIQGTVACLFILAALLAFLRIRSLKGRLAAVIVAIPILFLTSGSILSRDTYFDALYEVGKYSYRSMPVKMEQDYLLRHGRWDRIIESFPPEHHDLPMMNVLCLALAEKGLLGDRLFAYCPQGYTSILNDWDNSYIYAVTLSDIYYHIGDITSAQRYAMEGMTCSNHYGAVRLLQRLAETNLILGEYRVAEKYIRMMEQTLFYRRKGHEYRSFLYDDRAVENDAVMGIKRKALIRNPKYALSYNISEIFEQLAINNPDSNLPAQYLLAMWLADRKMQSFEKFIERRYGTPVLPALSAHHQEAVIAMAADNPPLWTKYGVSRQTIKQFTDFQRTVYLGRQLPDYHDAVEKKFGKTYWYYLLFTDAGKQ
jgi:hypothetical protein